MAHDNRKPPDRPTTLYRLFDRAGDLLYAGIAGNPGRRFEQHASDKPWWSAVATIRLEHFETRWEARAAELGVIRDELPAYNRADVPAEGHWVDYLRPATAACFPDYCERCRDSEGTHPDGWIEHPMRAFVEGGWLTGYYRCSTCGFTWTCGYAWQMQAA